MQLRHVHRKGTFASWRGEIGDLRVGERFSNLL